MKTNARLTDSFSEREQRHQSLALEAAVEGVVLLENKDILPISPCRIALYGAGARHTIKGGSGSGEVNVRHTIDVEEGLEQAGFEIATKDWLQRYDTLWEEGKKRFIRTVRRKLWWPSARVLDSLMSMEYNFPEGDLMTEDELRACGSDTCVYVLTRQSGEGRDMEDSAGSFRLSEREIAQIRLCAACFPRFVLLVNTGSPIDLSPLDAMTGIGAIVYMSQPGMVTGTAVAAVLTGEANPSGRLAVSWPKTYADVPYGDEFARHPKHAHYKEGVYVGYRYYDSFDVAPRYAFGYGLSYTHFALDGCQTAIDNDQVRCAVRVTNSGQCAGKEVVQVYVRCPGEDREYQRLAGFAKTDMLAPKEKQSVEIVFPLSYLATYSEESAETLLTEGKYLVCVGTSSRDTQPVAVIRIDRTMVLSRHRNLCKAAKHIAELQHANRFDIPATLPELVVQPEAVLTKQMDYAFREEEVPEAVGKLLNRLFPEDYINLCTGTGMSGEKRGFRTPGAVGHTTTAYSEKGIANVELCDGPAGLRVEKRAVKYPNGEIRAVDMSLSVYEFFPRWLLRLFLLGDPSKGQMLYQFVTGFPIEAMMAQTWNPGLVERIGRAVSEEMSEYGVTFWLAPALNIVRNPLCGRNYEYYSEDPLLSGLMATAATRGVQQTPENYATIKHFCVNNQETSRFFVSSEVDERVLREIYWRGFELVVKNARPKAVMTAYNKLNGVYCSNNKELCIDLLRREWGFDGLVMTDWMATAQGRAEQNKAFSAGVDLIMPGSEKEARQLLRAYENGCFEADELRRAAGRVAKAIVQARPISDRM